MKLDGWDTGYATTISQVNLLLGDPSAVPTVFGLVVQGMTVQGVFGPWSIVTEGGGELLHLQTMIASGTMSGGGAPAAADLTGIAVVLEINLLLLPPSLAGERELRFNFKTVGTADTPSAPGVVKPLKVLDPAKKLNFEQGAVLGAAVAQCLVEQASAITFHFARINIVPPDAGASWLTPVSSVYSYYQTDGGAGYLVVLSATDARDTTNLSRKIDPDLISGPGDAFFAISEGLFLQHVIMPILPSLYAGTDASYFAFDAVNQAVRATQAIGLGGVKSGLITYYPEITGLQITISGANVLVAVSGDCDLHAGMSLTFSVSSTLAASVAAGTGGLTLARDANPSISHDSHIPWYDYLLGPIPDIVMAIIVPMIADGIASGLSQAIGGLSFAEVAAQNVQWPGMKKFTIGGGELNGDFRLWGTLG